MDTSRFCYCGHLTDDHIFKTELSTFDAEVQDPEPQFVRCASRDRGKPDSDVCSCSAYRPFPLGTYRHLKTGHLYVAYGLEFDSETRYVRVQYARVPKDPAKTREIIQHGEKWTRPITTVGVTMPLVGKAYGFMDPDSEGRPRFQLVSPMYGADLVNNTIRIPPPFEIGASPDQALEIYDIETSETAELCLQIKDLEAEVEMWKRRAAAHGCNISEGDIDCG